MAIVANEHPIRDHVRTKLADILPYPCPINLEKGILMYTLAKVKERGEVPSWESKLYRHVYKQRFTIILQHLTDENCPLKDRIINKEIKSWQAASMDPCEMWPRGPYDTIKHSRKIKELHKEALAAEEAEAYTGMFKCPRCKQTKTTYYQQQTRSADEPMTTFVTCLNKSCGNRWKFC